MSDEKRTTEPHDRLTRLCACMTDALEADAEYSEDVQCIVFLNSGEAGGLQLHGYDSDSDAMADLFVHLRAIFRANGKELMFMPIGGDG